MEQDVSRYALSGEQVQDLRERISQAKQSLTEISADLDAGPERYRIVGKAQGVSLAMGYLDDALRMRKRGGAPTESEIPESAHRDRALEVASRVERNPMNRLSAQTHLMVAVRDLAKIVADMAGQSQSPQPVEGDDSGGEDGSDGDVMDRLALVPRWKVPLWYGVSGNPVGSPDDTVTMVRLDDVRSALEGR